MKWKRAMFCDLEDQFLFEEQVLAGMSEIG